MQSKFEHLKVFLIILFITNSLVYHEVSLSQKNDTICLPEISTPLPEELITDFDPISSRSRKPVGVLESTIIEGDYVLAGFFAHDEFINLDDDGSAHVLENFSDMKNRAVSTIGNSFYMDYTESQTWPDQVDTYSHLKKDTYPYANSSMFTPVFAESTMVTGKIHVLAHIDTYYFDSLDFTLKVSISIFNPSNDETSEITCVEEILPHGMTDEDQKVFTLTLNDTYTIPAGNRLKLAFEGKVSDLDAWAEVHLDSSFKGSGQYSWNINDGSYSNNYAFGNYDQVLGMQISYKSATFPEITVSGISNSTAYYEDKDVNITVSGAVSSVYRWDLDSYTSFSGTTSTNLPEIEGWHFLEVRANDSFNNTIIEVLDVGYDPTQSYILLHDTLNNTIIQSDSFLNFSTFGANSILCEWDTNGTVIDLLTLPDYDLPTPETEGYHNLTMLLNDTFILEEYLYVFGIDANAPQISILHLSNNTLQATGKLLEFQITDFSSNLYVNYKWDDNIFLPWSSSSGSIYRTYTPEIEGYHNLTITAEDPFGLLTTHFYMFNISSETLLVELRSMLNESWYQGGETVEITVSGTNGTILFNWDGSSFQDGTPYILAGQVLTLDGLNSVPLDSDYYHNLTIIVGSIDHFEYTYVFEFRIDTENPIISPSILDYYENRFKPDDSFTFILSDNEISAEDLLVLVSINGASNITLNYPHVFALSSFADGHYNLTLYVFDIAGNIASQFLIFYIDSIAPTIEVLDFEGFVTLPDSTIYVPSQSTIQLSISDDDTSFASTFSWDGSEYQTFTDTIILDYSDGFGILIINASDSIGNERILSYELTIDGLSPNVSLTFPFEYSTINALTSLFFHVEDVSQNTITYVEFHWDIFPGFSPEIFPDSNGDFELFLLPLYSTGEFAILTIYAEDIVGNNETYNFTFEVDITPPDATLYAYSEDTGYTIDALSLEFLEVGSELWYDNTTTPDLSIFIYYWNDDIGDILDETCLIQAPLDVGYHNLTIILRDNTGECTSPNEIELVLTFLLKAEGNLDILNISSHSCIYGENITIDVNFKNASSDDQIITKIAVNGTLMDFWHLADYNYRFYYCSKYVSLKGNYTLQIAVESAYYFGETNESTKISIEVQPIPLILSIDVSDVEIVEGGSVVVIGTLTYLNGTPVYGFSITFLIYLFYKSDKDTVNAAIENYDEVISLSDITGLEGEASVDYLLTDEIDHIAISATFEGSDILGSVSLDFEDIVSTIRLGLAPAVLYSIIGVSIFLLGLVSFIVYKITKRKPFEKYLSKISTHDLVLKVNEICPGVILSIFDQKRGPIPLVTENSFDYDHGGRFTVGTENFLLKLCDQAYSTLGFEDVHQGRKTSTINLPNEGLVGFVHAIQLENTDARGGFENLSIILMVHADYGNYLLAYSEHLYSHIDTLASKLKSKTGLTEIRSQISEIRLRTTQVILAGIEDMK